LSQQVSDEHKDDIAERMMRNIREKLYGYRWPPESPAILNASSFAVLSTRFLLDVSPSTCDAQEYEEELVRSHMRMLYSVHQDRQVKVTGSSPEPLLAEAAADIMHCCIGPVGNEKPYMNVWCLLGEFIEHGLIAQGDIGGLIGRALSISAMDRAIDALPKEDVRQLTYQTPVTVADYYKAFLTDEAWETLRRSTPANCAHLSEDSATKTFETAFAHAYFHFSHFGKANDSAPMRDDYAWAIWLRGTAIVCQLNQELSRVAPIYFSDPVRGVCPETMSVNLDQDKTSLSADPHAIAVQSAEALSIFSPGKKLPYIAAVHCYALTKNEGVTVTTANRRSPRNIKLTNDEEAPRYQINFHGLAAYRGFDVPTKAIVRSMINNAQNALFNQHPRPSSVPFLRRMLPVLTADPDSVAWFGGLRNAGR
jgi:hypothetical protein